MRFGSVCSGIEAASVAWHPLGWETAWLADIDKFPSAVLAHHYPDTPNLGDMTQLPRLILEGKAEAPDVLSGGTPCFTAGHLVLTVNGYTPIENIVPGDMVMTHRGRLRKVVRVGSKEAPVGRLNAVGLCDGLTTTADHPFLSVEWINQSTRRHGQATRIERCGEPEWVAAKSMPGRQWCALLSYERVATAIQSRKFSDEQTMYVAGMYLGDGHIRSFCGQAKKALVLSLNPEKLRRLQGVIGAEGYTVTQERTSVRATIYDTVLCEWLGANFGRLSHAKRLPSWAMSHELRGQLLRGYFDADGFSSGSCDGISTTSEALAYGVADLLNAEGRVTSVARVEVTPTKMIEGRIVNQRPWFQVRAWSVSSSKKSRVRHGYLLRSVQSYVETGVEKVFNIEVDEDHSYVINGAVVHNCQAFSVAGLRESLADDRGNLTLKFVEIADAIDLVRERSGRPPSIVVWENVPGVLSTRDNAFGCFLAGLAGEDVPLEPPGGRWTNAGCVLGPQRAVAWRTLDAQYFGLAQRRRRVWVVASARDGFDPAAVLLEWDRVRRDSPPRREAGKGSSAGAEGGAAGGRAGVAAPEIARCIATREGSSQDYESTTMIAVAQTLRAGGNTTGGHRPLGTDVDTCESLIVTFDTTQITSSANRSNPQPGDPCHPLAAGAHAPTIAFNARQDPDAWVNRTGPLDTDGSTQATMVGSAVRRLTPRECERLQGFPDDYTAIPWRGKPAEQCPDGPRYKALGNSWAVPVARWIGRRIEESLR